MADSPPSIGRRLAVLERIDPVGEVPPFELAEEAGRREPRLEPLEHAACAGQIRLQERAIACIPPVVVHHPDPEEREGRNELRQLARIAALRDPVGNARLVEQLDGVPHQAIVAGHVHRDERLDPRIADVLELLPVRRVHVGLVRAQSRRVPADVEDALQRRIAGLEVALALEGIRAERCANVRDRQRLGCGLDRHLHVPKRPPPQRAEQPAFAAVGQEPIGEAGDDLAGDLVAVPLLALLAVLSVAARSASAYVRVIDDPLPPEVTISGYAVVSCDRSSSAVTFVPAGITQGAVPSSTPAGASPPSLRATFGQPLERVFHQRNAARHEEPPRRVSRIARGPPIVICSASAQEVSSNAGCSQPHGYVLASTISPGPPTKYS